MLRDAIKQTVPATLLLLAFTVLTGVIYPLLVTLIAQICFPWQANGSLLRHNGKVIGSELIGQAFTENKYFFGRPSDTGSFPNNSLSSSGSNQSWSNPEYLKKLKDRITKYHQIDVKNKLIPIELITGSGSGLDPHISPVAAYYQVHRIASIRNIPESRIRNLIAEIIEEPTFGILGEPRINVPKLNLALDNVDKGQNTP